MGAMTISPTELTLRKLRADGYTAQVVEHWNSFARVRQDLFGVVDVIGLRGEETLAVQATSATNVSARIRKIADAPALPAIREAGWRFEVWGWRKNKANRWELSRQVDVTT